MPLQNYSKQITINSRMRKNILNLSELELQIIKINTETNVPNDAAEKFGVESRPGRSL
ncbi:hypothetical protein LguiB_028239 [Lonicera macranthoides]